MGANLVVVEDTTDNSITVCVPVRVIKPRGSIEDIPI